MGNTQERRRSRRSSRQSTAHRSRDRLGTTTSSLAETVQRSSHQRAPASGERSFRSDPDDILPGLDYSPEGIADQLRDMRIQRALDGTDTTRGEVPDPVLDVLGSGGQPLDGTIQRALESRMDADFSDVRIHTGAKAAEAADAIDAKAFTCGNDIVFNAGEYDPQSPEGQFLLAHELTHVTQQNGGAPISMMPKPDADLQIDPDPQLEREADEAAKEALAGGEPLTVNRLGADVHIQRSAKDSTLSRRELITLGNPEKGATPDQAADQSKIRRFLEEFSRLEFSLSHGELESVVENVSSVDELYDYLAARGIEPTSDLEEWINSPLVRGYKSGSAASSVMGLLNLGFTPAAIAALAVGGSVAFVLRRYGDEIGEEARKWLRSKLDAEHEEQYEFGETRFD